MQSLSSSRKWTASVAIASTLALLATALTATVSQPSSKAELPPKALDPLKVAQALDKVIQPRFQDAQAGHFGMSRLVSLDGHGRVTGWLSTDIPREKQIMDDVNATHMDFVISFFHCAHVPGKSLDPPTPGDRLQQQELNLSNGALHPSITGLTYYHWQPMVKTASGSYERYDPAHSNGKPEILSGWLLPDLALDDMMKNAAVQASPCLLRGQAVQADRGKWIIWMSPVRAEQETCLSCHTGAKRGDTLGVMAYAVSKKAATPAIAAP